MKIFFFTFSWYFESFVSKTFFPRFFSGRPSAQDFVSAQPAQDILEGPARPGPKIFYEARPGPARKILVRPGPARKILVRPGSALRIWEARKILQLFLMQIKYMSYSVMTFFISFSRNLQLLSSTSLS